MKYGRGIIARQAPSANNEATAMKARAFPIESPKSAKTRATASISTGPCMIAMCW